MIKKITGWFLLLNIIPLLFGLIGVVKPDSTFIVGYLVGWVLEIVIGALFGLVVLGLYLLD